MKGEITNINQYLNKVKLSVTQTFNLIDSYLDLLRYPPRPGYTSEEQR